MAKIPKSPGVIRQRIDASQSITVTGVSTGGIVGRFKKGRIKRPVYCESITKFITEFGAPEFTSGCKIGQGVSTNLCNLVPEMGYAGVISTLYLNESQMYIIRAYDQYDKYASVVVTTSGTSTSAIGISASDGLNPIVPEMFDTDDNISTVNDYVVNNAIPHPLVVSYVSPGSEGNDVAVITESFGPNCDWKDSYDNAPTDLTIKSDAIWGVVTSALNVSVSAILSATSISSMSVTMNNVTFTLSAVNDATALNGVISANNINNSVLSTLYNTTTSATVLNSFTTSLETAYPIATKFVRIKVYQKGVQRNWEDYYKDSSDATSKKMRLELKEYYDGTLTHIYDDLNNDLFIETAVNGNSDRIYVKANGNRMAYSYNFTSGVSLVNDGEDSTGYYVLNNSNFCKLSGGNYSQNTSLGGKDISFWNYFLKKKEVSVQLLIGLDSTTATKKAINSIATTRQDCFAILQSNPLNIVNYQEVINNEIYGYADPTACGLFAGYVLIRDTYSGRNVYVPLAGLVAKLYAKNDNIYNPWNPTAGLNRGIISEAISVYKSYDEDENGEMFEKNINTLQPWAGVGQAVWGDKTALLKKSYLDSISVVRTMLYIENNIVNLLPYFLWEFNNKDTRKRCRDIIDNFLTGIKVDGGIFDKLVVCDSSNNPPTVIDSDFMNVDVYIKPYKGIRWIKFTSIVTKQSVSFSDVMITNA